MAAPRRSKMTKKARKRARKTRRRKMRGGALLTPVQTSAAQAPFMGIGITGDPLPSPIQPLTAEQQASIALGASAARIEAAKMDIQESCARSSAARLTQ